MPDRYMMPYQCNISQNLISYFDLARSVPIKKPYSLHQSALVGDQNGIWILGLYHFVSEEFDHNVANYIIGISFNYYVVKILFWCLSRN